MGIDSFMNLDLMYVLMLFLMDLTQPCIFLFQKTASSQELSFSLQPQHLPSTPSTAKHLFIARISAKAKWILTIIDLKLEIVINGSEIVSSEWFV